MTESFIGRSFGSYQIDSQIGKDNSTAYLCHESGISKQLVLKVLGACHAGRIASAQEAHTFKQLRHPHIVPVFDFGLEDDILYLVREYVPKGSLRDHLPKGKQLPSDTILEYVKQIAEALDYIHSKGVIHRDLKPGNLLLDNNDEILLADFGIANLICKDNNTSNQVTFDETDLVIFDEADLVYMAPERLEGYASKRSDQYSLAVIVYEWLTGVLPFRSTPHGIYITQRNKYSWDDASPPEIPSAVEQVISIALAINPTNRYENIDTFVNDLEAAIQGKQKPIKKYLTEENKEHLESKHKGTNFYRTHQNILLQENDTFPILTNCLARSYIEKAFEHLPWLERNCLLLYADAELTQEDIAEILSLKKKAVQKHLVRATQLWLQAYNFLLEKDLGISLNSTSVSHHEDLSRVKRLIQSQNH